MHDNLFKQLISPSPNCTLILTVYCCTWTHSNPLQRAILSPEKMIEECYLGIKPHSILGGFVEFWVFEHVFFSAGALKYSQSEGRQSSEDLQMRNTKTSLVN